MIVVLALAACQGGGGPTDISPPSALQGPAVEVTTLAPAQTEATPAPVAPVIRSEGQIACEKRGGTFVVVGRAGVMTCQTRTRDAGKLCRRESDCDGQCLARSGTCAPVQPLPGCQSVLQEDGRKVTLCID